MGRSPHRLDAVDKVTGAGEVRRRHPPARPALRADPAPARPRRDARRRSTRPRPRSVDGVTVVNQDGTSSPCCTPIRRRPRRPSGASRPEWNAAAARRRHDGIFDDLLEQGAGAGGEGGQGRRGGRARRGDPRVREHLPQGLRRPRADGAARRDGRVREREAHRLGLDADALPDPRPARAGAGARPEERPRHHAVRRRRLRRQERRPPVRGGGAAREDHRPAGAGGLHPRRGVLLRHLRPGLRREDRVGRRRRREDHALGLRRLLRRRSRGGALLRRAQRPHAGLRRLDGARERTRTASASARGARPART